METLTPPVQILYRDENIVAFYKPHGFHTVPHENPQHRCHRSQVLLYVGRDLVNAYLYPIHRLDAGTSGVVVFALSSEMAKQMQIIFQNQSIQKIYETVIRGHIPDTGSIDIPLELDSTGELVPALTEFKTLARVEYPVAVGKRNPTAKYSLVEVQPKTGRYHQIRRHFARKSHPVLGDAEHGDSKHNQYFRNELGVSGLCLRARELRLTLPWLTNEHTNEVRIQSPTCEKWQKIHSLFDFQVPIE